MALVLADRVKETTATTGTGTITLAGAVTGYQSFSAIGNGNTTYYVIAGQGTSEWEVGIGTYTGSGTTLSRTTILASSNAGSLVSFSSGTKDVFVTYPSGKSVFQDSTGNVSIPTLQISTTTSTTPVLSFNAANSSFASGATISGSYLQFLLQNKSTSAGASTNYVLSNDLGTDSTYYGEFGMNSSIFSATTPADFFSINNGIYFSGHDGDIIVGPGNGFKHYLAWGTAGQSAHVINAAGAIGLNTNLGTTPALSGTTNFGTSGQVLTSAGNGATPTWATPATGTVTSVAALTLGTTGTDLSSTVATGTTTPVITLQVPTASATNRGALSSTDWSTFNGKQPAGSYLTSVTADAPLSGSGTSGSHLVIATANTTTTGAISSTDWNTFNGKQAALVSGTNIKTVAGVSLLGAGDIGLIGGTYGGTGVNNGANTITVGGNVNYSGAFTQTWTRTANTSLTLPVSGTLISSATAPTNNPVTGTPSSSNYLRGDGTWSAVTAGITVGTAVTASGTAVTFTGIPSTCNRITMVLSGVSTTGTSLYRARLGTSGGIVSSGYFSNSFGATNSGIQACTTGIVSDGFQLNNAVVSASLTGGVLIFARASGNLWSMAGSLVRGAGTFAHTGMGYISLGGTLTQIQLTTQGGADSFNAGTLNILIE
ncbi:hypothetical protein UFOVP12_22 [uncultured Caudovirales phage]|uniref:Uncharacterized protein n=1 Tax=uncultured Caudovirales phage TaxID=2100421 RepID=A0A6J5KIM7_9CAUD|nr:hypothetical protein UFOVP12_22 [uncultured Caudovirales phage]